MQWSEAVGEIVEKLEKIKLDEVVYKRLYNLVDLTSLGENDTESKIAFMCEKARSPFGYVAGVCVYPQFLREVSAQFRDSPVNAVTVANFPDGGSSLETVLIEISNALLDGANEIDIVFPYERYLAGERKYAINFVNACKIACGEKTKLKIILETGALGDLAIIADAAFDALSAGADFIKTSTGKMHEGATLEAVCVMLLVIKHRLTQDPKPIGCKVSGGIRDIEQAARYVELADRIMGKSWVTPEHFRIGASQLVDNLLKVKM